MELSRLSAFHSYTIKWNRILSTESSLIKGLDIQSEKELNALHAIEKIGVIGRAQLKAIFLGRDNQRVKKMERYRQIKRHELIRNNEIIPIYTLGATGIEFLRCPSKKNEWFQLNEYMVLERLIFFQLYDKLKNIYSDLQITEVEPPFIGGIQAKGEKKHFNVLVVRENKEKIQKLLARSNPKKPIICVCEDLIYLESLNPYLKQNKIRVTTDKELRHKDFESMFYLWHQGGWVNENALLQEKNNNQTKAVDHQ
ncbi:hypothetical protein [Bacillus piscicola]|uniref:hypothetical protein n=1 Tax=Bacillus piscicola TaxID=1632684 RepID=UPI001F09278E|nr:hypothetical protein [Bacillus piscicola]